MEIKFKLVNQNKSNQKLIVLYYYYAGKRFVFSTGENILAEHWSTDQRPSLDKELPRAVLAQNKITKNILDRHESLLIEIINEQKRASAEITNEFLKTELHKRLGKTAVIRKAKKGTDDFYEIIDVFINDSKKGGCRLTKKGTTFSARRLQKYEALKTMLKLWRPTLKISEINMDFYQQLINYRSNQVVMKKGIETKLAINTIGADIKVLKTVLHYTYDKKLHTNDIFKTDDFRSFEEIGEHVYLNDADIDKLWNMKDLPPNLELVRDIFVIGCYTALRISDLGVLESYNIIENNGKRVLKIIQHKGSEPVFIPIHKRVDFLLQKYNHIFPKAYADQTMNDSIKILCQKAGLKDKQEFKITRGAKVERFVKEKWQMVTNHTARRSFATNCVTAGMNPLLVMKITGHKTLKDFMRYVCVTQHQVALDMSNHSYFTGKD